MSRDKNKLVSCLNKLGYKKLTNLQAKAFKIIVENNNSVIIVAPTGTGKTEAAIFPILYNIVKNRLKPISALYITPLRALNRDIEKRLKNIAKCFGLTASLRHGDTPQSRRRNIVRNPPHILITTPETLNYLLITPDIAEYLKNVRYIVIDEFREIIESKRGLLLLLNIYLLEKILGVKTVKIALTATLRNAEKVIKMLSSDPSNVVILRDHQNKGFILELKLPSCDDNCSKLLEKFDEDIASRILYILEELRRRTGVLIFTNTRSIAEKLGLLINEASKILGYDDIQVEVHHGSLSRRHRVEVEEKFKKGEIKGLVATSSMELGIDIGYIDYVIQYMSPRQVTRLVQRIGRSGHRLREVSRGSIVTSENLFQILESLAITDHAVKGLLESETIISKPLDVLAYSITLYTIIQGRLDIDKFYKVVKQYVLYKDLSYDEYLKVVEYLCYSRILKCRDKVVYPSKRSRLYIYLHTMIPDVRDIPVIDISTKKNVGRLNEEYVVLNISPGDIIVLGGKPWRVIEYNDIEGKLFVEKFEKSPEVIIPHWEGENIPVSYHVAQRVGEYLYMLSKNNLSFIPRVDSGIIVDNEIINYLRRFLGKKLPTSREITIYYFKRENIILVFIYGGSKLNRLLRDILKYYIQQYYPIVKLKAYSTPYFIILHDEKGIISNEVIDLVQRILSSPDKYIDLYIIKNIAKNTGTLLWRIYQVAQRFGAINVSSRESITRKILESFIDTVIGDEAFNEVLVKDYDIESYIRLVDEITSGKVRITRYLVDGDREYVEILDEALNYLGRITSLEVKPLNRERYLERILNRNISLVCVNCGYRFTGKVREFYNLNTYRCPRCGYRTLAPLKTSGELEVEVIRKYLAKKKLSREEKKILDDLRRRASLLLHFGKTALLLLASPGVGVKEAIRILNTIRYGGDLLEEIYKSEKKYLKIKKYLR